MLYQYINASFQGNIIKGNRQGQGIVIDNHNNFICSDYSKDKLNNSTFICLHGNIIIYGSFEMGKMQGINTIDSSDYKAIGRYVDGKMVGKGIVINKTNNKLYIIDNDKAKNSIIHQSLREKEKGWESRLLVTNRYTRNTKSVREIEKELGLTLSNTQIQQFLQSITQSYFKYCESQFQDYFGFSGLNSNLGVTFSTTNLKFSAGLYSQPFILNQQSIRNSPQSPNYIHKTVFFPQLVSIKQNFINLLNFINIFQQRLLNLQNSQILIKQQSDKSEHEIEQKLLQEFNFGDQSNIYSTTRRSVALDKLNRSLGELLVMQEQMNRKSKERESKSAESIEIKRSKDKIKGKKEEKHKDRNKWILQFEEHEEEDKLRLRTNKNTLKEQLYSYMQQCQAHLVPKSKSKGKFKSPSKYSNVLKSPIQRDQRSPRKLKLKSILKNRQYIK